MRQQTCCHGSDLIASRRGHTRYGVALEIRKGRATRYLDRGRHTAQDGRYAIGWVNPGCKPRASVPSDRYKTRDFKPPLLFGNIPPYDVCVGVSTRAHRPRTCDHTPDRVRIM